MSSKLPNFLCVGAQRCGTTWLYENLREHDQVFVPARKELQFFSKIVEDNFSKGLDWYKKYFKEVDSEKAIGEITPEYLVDPEAPKRIFNKLGDIKILVIVRNPINRLKSIYDKDSLEANTELQFEEYVRKNVDKCLDRGRYYEQIQGYGKSFSQIDILVFEELMSNKKKGLQEIYDFIGVDWQDTSVIDSKFNMSSSYNFMSRIVFKSRDFLESLSGISYASDFLQRNRYTNRIIQKIISNDKDLEDDIHNYLIDYYYEDVSKLSELLGKDLLNLWRMER